MTERASDIPVDATTGIAAGSEPAAEQPAPAVRPAQHVPVVAVVLAAGFGTRFDPDNPKQLVSVGGKPIVCWSIEAFERCERVSDIVVVVNAKVRGTVESLIDEQGYGKVRIVIDGGAERVDSTAAALDTLAAAGIPGDAKILIHDAVRPFVEQSAIDGSIDALDQFKAATVAFASTDTILLTQDLGDLKVIRSVPDRTDSYRAQTPQSFRFATIRHAYELAAADPDFHPTDDTRVVVDYLPDEPVAIVAGSETNLKVTTLADIPTAERIAEEILGRDPKEEARARMHALLAQAAGQLR
ncbi:IspD/TarI family cytidylyltransferase [Bifidobacterium sp. SO4]|uniref:IspD/TarI family cytidylyltransferase n=1 Tax=Bifidobacterium sp. SO4 TaxID=2809030 RepID=UPI001BDD325A|nr:IspD/TarI family cytidylyltransferase [Bifidobacterium sp. SO4]MBT1169860.1 2-C-methyl-D-erythritol 4-phosphate cytidylyltransferase [Bifidobacterium sp. SO4]